MTLVLASGSASRRAMLDAAGIAHDAHPADVDESAIKAGLLATGHGPGDIALALGRAKALAVSSLMPGRWVLGGDSVVSVDGQMFSKPKSRDNAAEHLRCFSGKRMVLNSAAALAKDGVIIESVRDEALLDVRPLSEAFIARYLDAEWPAISGCVGCFRIEAMGVQLFDHITGSQFTVLGMPLLPVLDQLRRHGVIET
jgi:septum formation protein